MAGRAELIVVVAPDAGLRAERSAVASVSGTNHAALTAVAAQPGVAFQPLFGQEDRVALATAELASIASTPVPDLVRYYHVDAPESRLEELADELRDIDEVDAAYVKPPVYDPYFNDRTPDLAGPPPPVTPDFASRQGYLDAAPDGVDARFAWTWPGGGGSGVNIIDCEHNWHFDHEDLTANQGGVVVNTAGGNQDHGTAVIGELGGDRNSFGIIGIAPYANVSGASWHSAASASTIVNAANRLNAGDILLLEGHRPGPLHNFTERNDQEGYIALEWWDDDFAAIATATARGVIVVEAAGNGAQDLDDSLYSTRPASFPSTWTNPFNRSNRDSGAVIVGAGAPPPGTHGLTWGTDRSRLAFSNYGASVDAQGWGSGVTTTGYGDLQGGTDEKLWYADSFGGTSSASPIVTGALACLQGALRAAGKPSMTPAQARSWLRATGSPQQAETGRPVSQRIGRRPDLKQLINLHVKGRVLTDKIRIKSEGKESDFKHIKDDADKSRRADKIRIKSEAKELRKEVKLELKEIEVEEKFGLRENKLRVENKFSELEERFTRRLGQPAADVDARLADLESAVDELTHFIASELRPDLAGGALTREPDLWTEAEAAKVDKELKDKEHLAEG